MLGLDLAWLCGLSFAVGLCAFLAAAYVQRRFFQPPSPQFAQGAGTAVLLFDGQKLLDASSDARMLVGGLKGEGPELDRFLDWAEPRFSGLREALEQIKELGVVRLSSRALVLIAEWRSGLLRIVLDEEGGAKPTGVLDLLADRARDEELDLLRQVLDNSPVPIWTEAGEGRVTWANQAYVDLVEERLGGTSAEMPWPLPVIFPQVNDVRRLSLTLGQEQVWYDCHRVGAGERSCHYAVPSQSAVQAEQALSAFLQTLTQTFSYLPVGIALFDRQRRLRLFNPALTDLTALPVDFLSARPSFNIFLDALRDRGRIPEPNDYIAWRRRIAALDQETSNRDFEEIWTLPSGLTYRVAARPHPDGTLALLIQDITDEITSTRRLTAELELGQSVLDCCEEAIAVFDASGNMLMSNESYARLWGAPWGDGVQAPPLRELISQWREETAGTPFWSDVLRFVLRTGPCPDQSAQMRLRDGRELLCRLACLAGGATLVGFRTPEGARAIQSSEGVPLSDLRRQA